MGQIPGIRFAVLRYPSQNAQTDLTAHVPYYSMFRMMRNSRALETKLVEAVVRDIRDRLPSRWSLLNREEEMRVDQGIGRSRMIDAILELRDPQGISTSIVVDIKGAPVEPNRVSFAAETLREVARLLSEQDRQIAVPIPMMLSPFFSPLARERLIAAGISYADSTGNLRLSADRPAIFIETQGQDRNPFRENRPLQSLKGNRAARVVRSFLDYRPPFGTRELAGETQNALATVSRVSDLLEREAIIARDGPRGRISSVDWETLVRRWAMDYDFTKANSLTTYLEPRGPSVLFDRLREADFRYAVTGSFVTARLAPVAEPRLVTLYADDPESAADRLGLRAAETGGNVAIASPFDPVVFERTESADGITYARVTQVLLDLMTGPGRGPAEAEALQEWMRENEETWKLQLTSEP